MSDESAPTPPAARSARLIGFAILGALGVYALIVALNLGLWRGRSPGEGLFPFITAAGMIAFSIAGAAIALRGPRDAPQETPERTQFWRMGFYVAALLFYALTLESLGFIAATIVSVAAILRFAERYSWARVARHRDRRRRGLSCAVRDLARRDPARRHIVGTLRLMDLWQAIALGFSTALTWSNLALLLHRRVRRHRGRRAAGARAGRDDLAAAAVLVHDGHRLGADPDGRRVLRRAIWRLDHRDPGAHSGRSLRGRHLPRRLRDGAAGPRGRRARHRGVRLVHRRRAGDHRAVPRRAGARQCGARIRTGRIHRAGAARPAAGHAALVRIADQRAADGGVRPDALDRRQGPDLRHRALHVRRLHAVRRAQHCAARDGDFRRRRTAGDGGGRRRENAGRRAAEPLVRTAAVARRLAHQHHADPARDRPRLLPRAAAGRRRDALLVHRLRAGAHGSRRTRRASATARSRAWRGRNPPTMPRRNPRSCRCSRSASRRMP